MSRSKYNSFEYNFIGDLVTNVELQQLVEDLSLQYFQKHFKHKATFNNRLRTTGGRYLLKSHNIEINPKYLVEYGIETMEGIIKHELCHYHLHIEGKGYQHKDHDFKQLLKKVGAPRFCQVLPSIQQKQSYLIYKCEKCDKMYKRKRRINVRKYVCGSCRGKLKYIGKDI